MTAEIAVLNKSAVALATDSAVTISSGQQTLKIFESADKLFELSTTQPIGIMIYNGMQFLGVPLEPVIKGFRKKRDDFETVEDAANAFLHHLYTYVDEAPEEELRDSVASVIAPIATDISTTMQQAVIKRLNEDDEIGSIEDFREVQAKIVSDVLDAYEGRVDQLGTAQFLPRKDSKRQAALYKRLISNVVEDSVTLLAASELDRIIGICTKVLQSNHISNNKTGLVFAGFGEKEIFPTLISFEIDSVFEAKVRAFQTEHCDIDRNGRRAFVRPFAQKEMVDRFLYGLDDRLRSDITEFSSETVRKISEGIIGSIEIDDDQRTELEELAKDAEDAFVKSLNDDAFTSFQQRSRNEIESMVEFMPKPELAKMAEALIDLTSIKRKVSQELETVGGPVDVAVISKNDGFVWVKRKHYFPTDLNSRYFNRNGGTTPIADGETNDA